MEESLIEKLRQKEDKAQEYFYKTYAKGMFLLCYRYLNDEEEASEILNDGFYKVFTQINKFQNGGISGLTAWTKKIMINECLQHIRKRKDLQFVGTENLKTEDADLMPHVELEAEMYFELIKQLPLNYRTVFNLYVIEGYSHKEIADILEVSENTSRSHLLRAREILKEKIQLHL